MSERPSYRLPRTALPERYALEIQPDLDRGEFEGQVQITLRVTETIDALYLNALDLNLLDAVLVDAIQSAPCTISYRPDEEQVVLSLPHQMAPGPYRLTIRYRGTLDQPLRGFYRSSAVGPDGEPVVIASTQLAPTDARRVLPCWDEPDLKARFAVTLVVKEGLVALSNGRVLSDDPTGDGYHRVRFSETFPLSTYLLALAVGPFVLEEPVMAGTVPIRIVARPGLGGLSTVAAEAAVGSLQFFERYFEIPYPGEKLDHLAVPDFAAGAMENLGLVIYREQALLVDGEHSAQQERESVVVTVAHETAHMWFGDLVTMRWWNGIWLNEAFATFMQLLATDALHPEWSVWSGFGYGKGWALAIDGLRSTRPIEYPVGPPVEAWGMFDILTYQKGGAVLRMLEQYIGPDTFRRGISHYLSQHRYGNTDTADLWTALAGASGEPVQEIMDSWVFQGGYPLVHVDLTTSDAGLTLRQEPFSYHPHPESQGWKTPVALGIVRATGEKETAQVLLGQEPVTVPCPSDLSHVLVNDGAAGFFRVAYGDSLWGCLLTAYADLSPLMRLTVLGDAWAAALAGLAPLQRVVALWRTFSHEQDPDVWDAAAEQLALLYVVADDADRAALSQLIQEMAGPVLKEIGWDSIPGESERVERLRARVVMLLGQQGEDPDVRKQARTRFLAHLDGSRPLSPALLSAVSRVVATAGGLNEWDTIYHAFKNARTPQDETRYLAALAAFSDPQLVRRTLDLVLAKEVRTQDAPMVWSRTIQNRFAAATAWNTLESHWDEVLNTVPHFLVGTMLMAIMMVVEEPLVTRMSQWLHEHPVPQAARSIAQSREFQDIHRAFGSRVRGQMAKMLQ